MEIVEKSVEASNLKENSNHFETHAQDSAFKNEFWTMADTMQEESLKFSDDLFSEVPKMDLPHLQRFLTQYRLFTVYYITDLSLLIATLRPGLLRSLLAEILNDELGYGNPKNAHPSLYDNFLYSIGVPQQDLNLVSLESNSNILDLARKNLIERGSTYGVGLRGMGGECVCQVYISQLYEYLIQNKHIIDLKKRNKVDWKFWDLHVGDHDIEHREKTREIIDQEMVSKTPESLDELKAGYLDSMISWREFWQNISDETKSTQLKSQSNIEKLNLSSVVCE